MCQQELEIWTVTAVKSGASIKKEGGAGTAMLKASGKKRKRNQYSDAESISQEKSSSGLFGVCLHSCACFLGVGVGVLFVHCWGLVCLGLAA